MKGLLMMLKAFGLSDADIEKIRIFVPQVPAVAQNAIATVNKAVADFDARLKVLEQQQVTLSNSVASLHSLVREVVYENTALVMAKLKEIEDGIRSGQLQQSDSPEGDADRSNGVAHSGIDSPGNSARTVIGSSPARRSRGNR
jgi:phage baseplate assembly protein W